MINAFEGQGPTFRDLAHRYPFLIDTVEKSREDVPFDAEELLFRSGIGPDC